MKELNNASLPLSFAEGKYSSESVRLPKGQYIIKIIATGPCIGKVLKDNEVLTEVDFSHILKPNALYRDLQISFILALESDISLEVTPKREDVKVSAKIYSSILPIGKGEEPQPPTPVKKTCKFIMKETGDFTITQEGTGSYYLKTNGGDWEEYSATATISVTEGDEIELKSEVDITPVYTNGTVYIRTLSFKDNPIEFEIEGDIIGTLYLDNYLYTGSCFEMFKNCTGLKKMPNLIIKALSDHACASMFEGCTSLIEVSSLPNIFVQDSSYVRMFYGCTSLVTAPELPATILGNSSYSSMFSGCTSLTIAPELPATILGKQCYSAMFYGCTGLITAPELPATTLVVSCYQYMFYGCTSLVTAPELPATTLVSSCYSHMFDGCTGLTSAPELPATTLVDNCYEGMFQRCSSLTTAPELPATTLVSGCYSYMFRYCTLLNYIKCLSSVSGTNTYTRDWVKDVSATGTFVKNSSTSWSTGYYGIPYDWTVENAAA